MKTERKTSPRYRVCFHRSVPDLLASGVATVTFDNGHYIIRLESDDEALDRDHQAIVRDARRAYLRFENERESA